jgi:hypothetical protein
MNKEKLFRIFIILLTLLLIISCVLICVKSKPTHKLTPKSNKDNDMIYRSNLKLSNDRPYKIKSGSNNQIGWDLIGKKCTDGSDPKLVETAEPRIFGPIIWPGLHIMAQNYPENPNKYHKQGCKKFLAGLPFMLPCADCGSHLLKSELYGEGEDTMEAKSNPKNQKQRMKNMYNACSSRYNLSEFLVEAHNKVNENNGKPTWTGEQAKNFYSKMPACLTDGKEGWFEGDPLETFKM